MTYRKQTQQTRARHATQRTTNREQAAPLRRGSGVKQWNPTENETQPNTKPHDKNFYAINPHAIGADAQKQQS